MFGANPTEEIRIVQAGLEQSQAAASVVASAFQQESAATWLLSLSTTKQKQRFRSLMGLWLDHMLCRGDRMLVALIGEDVVGVAVLSGIGCVEPTPSRRRMSWYLGYVPLFLGVLPQVRWRRVLSPAVGRAMQKPAQYRQRYHSLEWLAVAPAYQGRGIGRLLLARVRDLAQADPCYQGIYISTVGDANRTFYEHSGCRVVSSIKVDAAYIVHHVLMNPEGAG